MDTTYINQIITAAIKANGNKEITGNVLQSILLQIVSALNTGKQDTLISGSNFKTINGQTLLTGGNIDTPEMLTITLADIGDLTLDDATRSEMATHLGISETEVDKLFGGEYALLVINTTSGSGAVYRCCLQSSEKGLSSSEAIFGITGGTIVMGKAGNVYSIL